MTSSASLMAQKVIASCALDDPAQVSIDDLIIYYNGWVQEKPLHACDGRTVMKNGRAIVSVRLKSGPISIGVAGEQLASALLTIS